MYIAISTSVSISDLSPSTALSNSSQILPSRTLITCPSQTSCPQIRLPCWSENFSPWSRVTIYNPQARCCHLRSWDFNRGAMAAAASGKCFVRKYSEERL